VKGNNYICFVVRGSSCGGFLYVAGSCKNGGDGTEFLPTSSRGI